MIDINIKGKKFDPNGSFVIKNLKMKVKPGEFACLIGPSGAGKSSLLNIISGLDTYYDGSCSYKAGKKLAYIFQEPRLMPWLNVEENIALVCDDPDYDEINSLLQLSGLEGKAKSFPSQLSGGMQRRAAMVRAFIVKPELLLLDEPFISLDEPSANKLRQQLEILWLEHKPTVLFVTHQLREAVLLADKLIFFSKGPATVILEKNINLIRSRFEHPGEVDDISRSILQQYPEILSGIL